MIEGYDLIRSDHPGNTMRGGVCIYYKESLTVRIVNIPSLTAYLVCEVTIQTKKDMLLLCIYLLVKALLNLNPFCLVWRTCLIMQFVQNHCSFRLPQCQITSMVVRGTTMHSTQIDFLTTAHGFKQIISDPTHIFPQSSSCINLSFTDELN